MAIWNQKLPPFQPQFSRQPREIVAVWLINQDNGSGLTAIETPRLTQVNLMLKLPSLDLSLERRINF